MRWLVGQELQAEFERAEAATDDGAAATGLNPGLLNGPDGPRMGTNVQRNMKEGRIVFAMGVFERV